MMQIAAATDRKVKAKTADAQTALVVAKEELTELEDLRKLRKVWVGHLTKCTREPTD